MAKFWAKIRKYKVRHHLVKSKSTNSLPLAALLLYEEPSHSMQAVLIVLKHVYIIFFTLIVYSLFYLETECILQAHISCHMSFSLVHLHSQTIAGSLPIGRPSLLIPNILDLPSCPPFPSSSMPDDNDCP